MTGTGEGDHYAGTDSYLRGRLISMHEYLLFRLYGSMASWGDIAVGEFRPTFDHPSKSAVMGLIAAAMGIRRDEEERQRELAAGDPDGDQNRWPGYPVEGLSYCAGSPWPVKER